MSLYRGISPVCNLAQYEGEAVLLALLVFSTTIKVLINLLSCDLIHHISDVLSGINPDRMCVVLFQKDEYAVLQYYLLPRTLLQHSGTCSLMVEF